MPYTKEQHGLFGAALGAKKGQKGVTEAAKKIAKTTSKKKLEHMVKSDVKESATPVQSVISILEKAFGDSSKIKIFFEDNRSIGFNATCIKHNISPVVKMQLVEAIRSNRTPQVDVHINEQYDAKFNEYIGKFTTLTEAKKKVKQRLDPKCWTGWHKEGTKVKGGVRVNKCVKNRK